MGAPLLSDTVTPSCRRCRRAWLESPLRVSKYVPQTSHMTGCGVAAGKFKWWFTLQIEWGNFSHRL